MFGPKRCVLTLSTVSPHVDACRKKVWWILGLKAYCQTAKFNFPPSFSVIQHESYLHVVVNISLPSCTDCDGDTLTHSLVQYTFDDDEHPVSLHPHGNSKKKESFIRTMPSTLQKLKNVA